MKQYHPSDLNITWFDLSKEYIDNFPDKLFDYAIYKQLLYWHSHSREIDFKDIQNPFLSKRKEKLIRTINLLKYQINISEYSPYLEELENMGCLLSFNEDRNDNEYTKTSEDRFNQDILDSDSIEFIKERNLDIEKISACTNGYYSVLADIDIYKAYTKEHVQDNIFSILHNAIIGEIGTIKTPASLFHFPGNVPKLMNEYDVDIGFKALYNSFISFLNISLLYPCKKKKNLLN